MPGKDGLQATREILLHLPKTKILVLSGYDTKEYVKKILESGAHGYLLKTTSPDELYAAIEAVYSGEAFFSPHISKILLDDYIGNLQRGSHEHISVYHGPLTRRECEILRLIALGNSHAVIADLLHLSIRTVDTHRNNIMKKLDLHDTASLVTYAIREGIAEFPL
jgi:DNA-binding NarL/FixJ family response regulator